MKIRKFKEKDAEKASKMILDVLDNSRNLPKSMIEEIKSDSKPERLIRKSKSRKYFVIEENGQIVAISGLKNGEVIRMYTSLNKQRKGFGSKILDKIEKEAKKEGLKNLFLYTSNPDAIKFYEKNKFKIKDKFKDRGIDVYYLEKRLK